ncbi:F-box protein At4g35733-like [Rosa rugosa]|uniref:F-box protein At4g35733-like n=1 Tax=Rosa rugosa TaxID=74645 RepID=UPI002B40E0E5|nr:F-box protein At4g35733-like [Rosa rugosa]
MGRRRFLRLKGVGLEDKECQTSINRGTAGLLIISHLTIASINLLLDFKLMDSSDWAKLQKHPLDLVLERLTSPLDYVRFSAVCMSWNSVADDNLSKRTAPMLLSYTGEEETWNLCDVADDKVLDLQLELPNKRFCGSRGWLITMDENFIVTLINPFSRVNGRRPKENSIINLPALLTRGKRVKQCDFNVFKATISADPISNAKDCIVMIIYEPSCQLAFIRLNKDTTWTYIDSRRRMIEDVLYVGDKFYAVDYKSQLFCIDITTQFDEEEDVILVAEEAFEQDKRYLVKNYLVELSENELLMVKRYMFFGPGQHDFRITLNFELFKLDHDNCEWTKINTLGDVALFIGDSSTISVLASSSLGYLPNCIYFLHDWDRQRIDFGSRGPRDFGVYNIESKKFSRDVTTHAAALMKMSNRTPIWTQWTVL